MTKDYVGRPETDTFREGFDPNKPLFPSMRKELGLFSSIISGGVGESSYSKVRVINLFCLQAFT